MSNDEFRNQGEPGDKDVGTSPEGYEMVELEARIGPPPMPPSAQKEYPPRFGQTEMERDFGPRGNRETNIVKRVLVILGIAIAVCFGVYQTYVRLTKSSDFPNRFDFTEEGQFERDMESLLGDFVAAIEKDAEAGATQRTTPDIQEKIAEKLEEFASRRGGKEATVLSAYAKTIRNSSRYLREYLDAAELFKKAGGLGLSGLETKKGIRERAAVIENAGRANDQLIEHLRNMTSRLKTRLRDAGFLNRRRIGLQIFFQKAARLS